MKSDDDQKQHFRRVAEAALAQYDLGDVEPVFLAIGGNVTFRVESQKHGGFLLRLHHTVAGLQEDLWKLKPEKIESELMWLAALRRDTDIVVQEPVQNRSGHFVTLISFDDAHEPICCTLLHWIDGKHIDRLTPAHATQLGTLVARLHEHTRHWKLPQGFTRPRREWEWLHASLIPLRQGVEIGTVSAAEYEAFEEALPCIQPVMNALGEKPQTWGLIHGDLHSGNYLVHNGEIRPIDFSGCGFGHYLYEVGDTIRYLPPPYYQSFLDGYQSLCQLPDDYQPIIEAFFIGGMASNLAYLALNPDDYEGLSRQVKSSPNSIDWRLRKYLNGEPFLFNS
ncbi:phosphotransferase [Candidatus Poribacteria bacterium]|nr:phosphotransferase [Candidatus Poribacteria bacterium]